MIILPDSKLIKNCHNRGQALLVVLLVLSIVLTIAMSAVSRSITDITVTTYEDTSSRALTAAEAGVEEAFLSGLTDAVITGTLPNEAEYTTEIDSGTTYGDTPFEYPKRLLSGETATFWFVSHNMSGDLYCDNSTTDCLYHPNAPDQPFLRFCWGDESLGGIEPALELTIYYDPTYAWISGNYDNIKVWRRTFDPLSRGNGFSLPSTRGCPFGNYDHFVGWIGGPPTQQDFQQPCGTAASNEGCFVMARARLLYNDLAHPVAMDSNGNLPSQGVVVSSTGVSGETTRKISVLKSFPEPPPFLDASLFSSGGIVK